MTLSANGDYEPAPRVAELSDGGFAFAWANLPDSGDGAIHLQKLAADGTPQFANDLLITGSAGEDPAFCDVVGADNGGFVVSWVRDISSFQSPRHVRAQKFDAGGNPLWGAYVSVFDATSVPIAHTPILLSDGSGGAVLGWHRSSGSLFNSLVQHLDAGGTELFAHNGLEVAVQGATSHLDPTLAYNGATGEIFAFWNERNSGQSNWGIYGQRISPAGARLWGAGGAVVAPLDATYEGQPRCAVAGDGAAVVYFDEPTHSVVEDRVRAARLDAAGTLQWGGAPIDVASTLSDKGRLPTTVTAGGMLISVWEDDRNGELDLFAQNVNPNGTLGVAFPAGDLNCDGAVDGADIDAFFLALGFPDDYGAQYPDCDRSLADMNGDEAVDGADIDPFFDCLGNGNCP